MNNRYDIVGDTVIIHCNYKRGGKGYEVYIDLEDLEKVAELEGVYSVQKNKGYLSVKALKNSKVATTSASKSYYPNYHVYTGTLNRIVTGNTDSSVRILYLDGNPLNLRKGNLILKSVSEVATEISRCRWGKR